MTGLRSEQIIIHGGKSISLKFLKVKAPEKNNVFDNVVYFSDSPMPTHKSMGMKYFPKQNWLFCQSEQKGACGNLLCINDINSTWSQYFELCFIGLRQKFCVTRWFSCLLPIKGRGESHPIKACWGGMEEGDLVNMIQVWSPWGNDQVLVNNWWLTVKSGMGISFLNIATEWYKPESRSEYEVRKLCACVCLHTCVICLHVHVHIYVIMGCRRQKKTDPWVSLFSWPNKTLSSRAAGILMFRVRTLRHWDALLNLLSTPWSWFSSVK